MVTSQPVSTSAGIDLPLYLTIMHMGRECSRIGQILRLSCFLYSALEVSGQAQCRCPGAPHPQPVARCPVAPVVARGGAVLRAGAVAVVVELFASVS